jgi:hypothetical protein
MDLLGEAGIGHLVGTEPSRELGEIEMFANNIMKKSLFREVHIHLNGPRLAQLFQALLDLHFFILV